MFPAAHLTGWWSGISAQGGGKEECGELGCPWEPPRERKGLVASLLWGYNRRQKKS